jgi:hypothetical protein
MMTIGRMTGRDRYKTKALGSITDQTMVSVAFGGIIRTLADKVHTPIKVDSMVIGCITYGKLEINACRLESIITPRSFIEEQEHVI